MSIHFCVLQLMKYICIKSVLGLLSQMQKKNVEKNIVKSIPKNSDFFTNSSLNNY